MDDVAAKSESYMEGTPEAGMRRCECPNIKERQSRWLSIARLESRFTAWCGGLTWLRCMAPNLSTILMYDSLMIRSYLGLLSGVRLKLPM